MPIIDDRSPNRNYPIPNAANDMVDDVVRIAAAINGIDADVYGLILAVGQKAAIEHTHSIGQINGLQSTLDDKAASNHSHALDDLTNVDASTATGGQFFKFVGTAWQPASIAVSDVGNLESILNGKAGLDGSSVIVPQGDTAARPPSPSGARIRYNTQLGFYEGWGGGQWSALSVAAALLKALDLADVVNKDAALANLGAQKSIPGSIDYFPRTTAPAGWLKANGALLNRTAYPALWNEAQVSGMLAANDAAWATNPGMYSPGNGTTTFRIPDLRGEFIRGFDDGRGIDIGRAVGSNQGQTIQSHNHGVNDPTHAHSVYDPGHSHGYDRYSAITSTSGSTGSNRGLDHIATSAALTGIAIYGAGTGISIQHTGSPETRPRNVALLACIKY
ncbi:tail fiber protein [Microvirga brassicacearum]|uniref:Phage tail collar domain-containing protein n=1 Tax=Microvirga brassicacearum TaxID=2580413 RepID=A0A5N3PH79_9HYPH|nr:tail fiber protein [Microvirga brassicacearum]KAB0269069.1 hypothetical protein FEZ63_02880 [Microvirga brassicacearum]